MQDIQNLKELLPGILDKLKTPEKQIRSKLVCEWPAIAGEKIAPKTKPVLMPSGELCVWVEQPALAYELSQKYRLSLLKRVQASLGENTVTSIRFCVGQIR